MPGPTNTSATAGGKANTARFELPQLTPVNYSLTEGTNIPPPPDSPIEEKPEPVAKPERTEPVLPTIADNEVASPTTANTNGGVYDGRGRTNHSDQPPLSPASTTRAGSIRRFLSKRSLNSHYANGTNNKSTDDLSMMERPGSSLERGPRPKRSTSWFRRFGSSSNGNAGNRTSVVYEEDRRAPEKKGPPAPSLPELKLGHGKGDKGEDGGSLGGEEMFKNIK